jgi:hypothetical protein
MARGNRGGAPDHGMRRRKRAPHRDNASHHADRLRAGGSGHRAGNEHRGVLRGPKQPARLSGRKRERASRRRGADPAGATTSGRGAERSCRDVDRAARRLRGLPAPAPRESSVGRASVTLDVGRQRSSVLVELALRPETRLKPESHRKCVTHGRGEGPRRTGFDCEASTLLSLSFAPRPGCIPIEAAEQLAGLERRHPMAVLVRQRFIQRERPLLVGREPVAAKCGLGARGDLPSQ